MIWVGKKKEGFANIFSNFAVDFLQKHYVYEKDDFWNNNHNNIGYFCIM